MNYYVYRIDDPITNEFYIGSRQCSCKIEKDEYMGSMKTWKPDDKKRLVKTVLKSNFRKIETARIYEIKIIKEHIDNPLNRNYHIPDKGFHNSGNTHSIESKNKMSATRIGMYSGITYEERHGKELADKLKKQKSEQLKKNNPAKLHHVKQQLIQRNLTNNPMNSEEARKKVSDANKGRIPWNKGITWKIKKYR